MLKTSAIRTRIDPLTKSQLEKVAAQEQLDLSDVVRRALRDFLLQRSVET
jgi:antitoxin component of RelBE/YafQ-DinJ toxin-antitoxin module